MSASARGTHDMTLAEFLRWNPADALRYQLVDGEPVAMAPASFVHGYLQAELAALLRNHLRARCSPCHVIVNPEIVPRFLSAHNFRIPDLGVTCAPIRPGAVMVDDPLLLVEILSLGNQVKTWNNVRAYLSIPSLREVLVLRADRVVAEQVSRAADGVWPDEPASCMRGRLTLASVGLELDLTALYAPTGL